MTDDSFPSNSEEQAVQNDDMSSSCRYFVVKAQSMDALLEMNDRKCVEPLNASIRAKILESARETDVVVIVTVNGSRNFQAYAKVKRGDSLTEVSPYILSQSQYDPEAEPYAPTRLK